MIEEVEVSVVMPAYNCADTIAQAIDSVLIQDVNLELLVINDGSPDQLDAVMEHYTSDPRVRYLKNESNLGVSATRNKGIAHARGTYVAFLDADDYWMQGKLNKQLSLMKECDAVLCATGRELIKADGTLTGRVIGVKEHITYEDLLRQNWINNSSVLIRRSVLLEFPIEADEVHEDYLLWLRVLRKYKEAVAVNEPLLKYRVMQGSKSGNKIQSARMTYRTYRLAGLGKLQSIRCFVSYAVAGIKKYYI